uniref:Putative secreted protein n=1 Tax=Ixodes ricinus TaxID=34613 RepID=A0A6B0V365_IXORI
MQLPSKKTRSRLCWCLVCSCVCVSVFAGGRAAVPTESPTHRLGTVGRRAPSPSATPLGPWGRPQRSVIFSRSRVSIYRRMNRGKGDRGKKKGFLSSPARQSLDHVDVGPASSSSSCEAIRWRTWGRGPGCRWVWLGALGAGWWGRGGGGDTNRSVCVSLTSQTPKGKHGSICTCLVVCVSACTREQVGEKQKGSGGAFGSVNNMGSNCGM